MEKSEVSTAYKENDQLFISSCLVLHLQLKAEKFVSVAPRSVLEPSAVAHLSCGVEVSVSIMIS